MRNWAPTLSRSAGEIRQDLEVFVEQAAMRDDVLAILDAIAESDRADLHPLVPEFRLRLDRASRQPPKPASRLRQVEDQLSSVQGPRDYRYPVLLSELFAPALDGAAEGQRLRRQELDRLASFAEGAQSRADFGIAKSILLGLRRAKGGLPQVEEALAWLAQAQARQALDAGCPGAARKALAEISAQWLDPALIAAIEGAERHAQSLEDLMRSAEALAVADWPDLEMSETTCGQLSAFHAAAPGLAARCPELGLQIQRLRRDQEAFLQAQAESCQDLFQVSQLLERLNPLGASWIDRLSSDWFEVAQAACRRLHDEAMETATSPAQLTDALPPSPSPPLTRLVPELTSLRAGLDEWASDWVAVESGAIRGLRRRDTPPEGLRRRLDDLAAKRAMIASLAQSPHQPEPSLLGAVGLLRADPALRSEVDRVLEQLERQVRHHEIESFLTRLDVPPHTVPRLDEALREAIPQLSELRDAQPLKSHQAALIWWRRWEELSPTLDAACDEYSAFGKVLETIRDERLGQWQAALERLFADGAPPLPDPDAIARDLRDGGPVEFAGLAATFERLGLERTLREHLRLGRFDDAGRDVARLKQAGAAPAFLDNLTLQMEIGRSRAGEAGSTALHHLWIQRSADIILAMPDIAGNILLEAFQTAWHDGDLPALNNLAATTPFPGGDDASIAGRLNFWRNFVISVPALLDDFPLAADFERLGSALFGDLPVVLRPTVLAPLKWLAAEWEKRNSRTALAWCALVLAPIWPELAPFCSDAPRHLTRELETGIKSALADIRALPDLRSDTVAPVLQRCEELQARWRHLEDCLRRATVPVGMPAAPKGLARATTAVDSLRRLTARVEALLSADFRDPATHDQWISIRTGLLALKADLGKTAFSSTVETIDGLEPLFRLRPRFERYVEACRRSIAPDDLDNDDDIGGIDGLAGEMQVLLRQCGMQDSPGAALLWADCARTLTEADAGMAALLSGQGPEGLRAAIQTLGGECRDMRRLVTALIAALPSTVVESPKHIAKLVAAFPKDMPPRRRPQLLLRRFCRHDVMPGLLARHPSHFPAWVRLLS
ncbi:hypothetical protein [Paramagnetospirillum magneticum]|uniref:Uncharacterized protein n=1 Tax=Paramagnetospirillum magneticum (strain ATCC 700264 / AMB-1) TaxID=342108 RepID=Q2W307_PARM1|nr:hypothetical protein [Paramagnetospirillum magneticum]BAE51768.1 hypothetical protein amb2964 [Paramagnetospirillum magneticum AMB-1]